MKRRRFFCALLLALLVLPLAAQADVIVPGQKPPRNEQSEAFVKVYADSITGWDSAYGHAFEGEGEVILWRYPGSGQVMGRSDSEWFHGEAELSETFTKCYKDSQGRFWGYIGYIYGQRMNWICISDPASDSLPADPAVVKAVDREVAAMLWGERYPAVLLTAAAVVVTAVLLYFFWYRKKKRGE